MERHLIEKKPTWCLLYTNGGVLVGLIWLLEISVVGDAARLILELGAVGAMFVLMLVWLRVNRGRIELAEAPVTRRDALEPTAQNGTPSAAPRAASPIWRERPPRRVGGIS